MSQLTDTRKHVIDWDNDGVDEHTAYRHLSKASLRALIRSELKQHAAAQIPPLSGEEIRQIARESARETLLEAVRKEKPGFMARLKLLFFKV